MMDLLEDDTTYHKKHEGFAASEADKFKVNARKILGKNRKREEINRASGRGSEAS